MSELISVIVSTKNPGQSFTQNCLQHLAQSTVDYELILINRKKDWSIGSVVNQGIRAASGNYIAFLCDDCFLEPDALKRMQNELQDSKIGVVGALLRYPNGLIQHAGADFSMYSENGETTVIGTHRLHNEPFTMHIPFSDDPTYVTGALMMTRRDVIDTIGGYGPYTLGWGDTDFCLRARQRGYRIKFCSTARAEHLTGSTVGRNNTTPAAHKDLAQFVKTWGSVYANAGAPV